MKNLISITMKASWVTLLLLAATVALGAGPAGEEKKGAKTRLMQIDSFPEVYRDAVRAVIAALSTDGGKPSEYFGAVFPGKDGLLEISLQHQNHPDEAHWRGDQCGRCRMAFYDPKTGKVLRFEGVQ